MFCTTPSSLLPSRLAARRQQRQEPVVFGLMRVVYLGPGDQVAVLHRLLQEPDGGVPVGAGLVALADELLDDLAMCRNGLLPPAFSAEP